MQKISIAIISGMLIVLVFGLAVIFAPATPRNFLASLAYSGTGGAAQDNSFQTITERCKASGIPASDYDNCCRPPVYWLNPACPYQIQGQELVRSPKADFGSDEEKQVYQGPVAK